MLAVAAVPAASARFFSVWSQHPNTAPVLKTRSPSSLMRRRSIWFSRTSIWVSA